jgi:hypothetical protein
MIPPSVISTFLSSKSFANFGSVEFDEIRNLNPVNLLKYKFVIIENPKESLSVLENRLDFNKKDKKETVNNTK